MACIRGMTWSHWLAYAAHMERTDFGVETGSGELSGWLSGDGPNVVAIHGGPGLSYDYLDDTVVELANRYRVATYQQRGLAPSATQGHFTVAEAVSDIGAVLDGLGWETAYLMGHSWGGHLVFHAALGIPERISGVLSVDPLGATGDGGAAAFGAEMAARVPEQSRARAIELDAKHTAGQATPEEFSEGMTLFWPSYFADPSAAPSMPRVEFSRPANLGLSTDLQARLPELEASLPRITVPVGVLVGELSPMPPTAGTESAARIPGAWSQLVPGAGHFPWHEAPGCVVTAMDRLVGGT